MILTSFNQWLEWAERYSMLPCVAVYPLEETIPVTWSRFWECAGEHAVVLESGKGGRYTFAAHSPVSTITGRGGQADIETVGEPSVRASGQPLQLIRQWMKPHRSPRVDGLPKFIGGCVGFLGYDVARSLEKLPRMAADDLGLPDYAMMRFDTLWIVDRETRQLYCAVHTPVPAVTNRNAGGIARLLEPLHHQVTEKLEQMKRDWEDMAAAGGSPKERELHESRCQAIAEYPAAVQTEKLDGIDGAFRKEDYIRAVEKIQDYIAQGDVFQVNLSVRQSRKLRSRPEEIYEWLRLLNPSPYMGMLRLPGIDLVSGSPELLVAVEGGKVSTRPIAGTRPRGADEAEDFRLSEELISNEKERAEHIMLVDLLRNDLGRISRYGTVKVNDFMVIERYSHVMHIVSEVRGMLAEGKTAYDVAAAVFPGGTITGAPKIRTMEIIEELEPVRRGPYTGSIGWIDYNGNMELNITIRTLVVSVGWGHVQAGAGIVIDSIPEKEYAESLNKAKALWKAILLSEEHQAAPETEVLTESDGKKEELQ